MTQEQACDCSCADESEDRVAGFNMSGKTRNVKGQFQAFFEANSPIEVY